MAPSTKTLKFMSTAVYIEIINFQTKANFPTLVTSLCNRHEPHCGSYKVASKKSLNFMSATVYEILIIQTKRNIHILKIRHPRDSAKT